MSKYEVRDHYKDFFAKHGNDKLSEIVRDLSIEELYQLFKARFMDEYLSEWREFFSE